MMSMKAGSRLHGLKFSLWDFARRHPNLGRPIRLAGKLATRRDVRSYHRSLSALADEVLPEDRYLRPPDAATQAFVAHGPFSGTRGVNDGLGLLLNHLRIPYRRLDTEAFFREKGRGVPEGCGVLFYEGEEEPPSWVLQGGYGFAVVVFGCSDRMLAGDHETLCSDPVEMKRAAGRVLLVRGGSRRFLPARDGLRSPFSAAFIEALLKVIQRPLVTGMMPPQVGLRLDDVTGQNGLDYLPAMLQAGWRPNLGVFTEEMSQADSSVIRCASDLAHQGEVDLSPHGLSANRFLFFDYPHGREYTREEFRDRWNQAMTLFEQWRFPLSQVVNAHFHTISKSCLEMFEKEGVRYYFSEKPPGSMLPHPDQVFLPAGDPTCTTGQDWNRSLVQIYSGDNSVACMQKDSLYDFMMHADFNRKERHPALRIMSRLKLSLWCGFSSFITTHEYLLSSLHQQQQEALWGEVNESLNSMGPFRVINSVNLSTIGENCYNHTNTHIQSVGTVGDRMVVTMTGHSIGRPSLGVFRQGRVDWIHASECAGRTETVIPC